VVLTDPVLIRHQGEGEWRAPATTAYTNEAELRDLLAETPSLLPGVGQGPAAATTEMPIPGAGSADVVIVEVSGEITVVECKLRANPQIRREVVGQALAYASAMWQMTYQDLDQAFQRSEGKVPLAEAFAADDEGWDEEAFRNEVADNLAEGRMRLVIAVDEITDELERRARSLCEIPGVEKYYKGLAKAGYKKSPRLTPHVLTSDEILEDFKRVISEAARPPAEQG